jgi:phenylacetate-CoA ligase
MSSDTIYIPPALRGRPYAEQHFGRIVAWASGQHPFYRQHIPDPGDNVPLLSREQILDNNELLLNGHEITGSTSGSTGVPVKVAMSPARGKMEGKDNLMMANWMGGPVANMKIVSLISHEESANTLEVNSPLEQQVAFIRRMYEQREAVSLITYPTNMEALCHYILDNNIDMAFIRRCCCMSECYEDYHDGLIARAFPNAYATSTYSSVELGMIAVRCPENRGNHHIMAHKLGVEFLNDEGSPCELGELGRIVITDYFNRSSPFIRYEIGDLAAPAECDCTVTKLPAMQKIIGKVRGTLLRRDGRRIMFTDFSVVFRDSPAVKQYQVIQEELEKFTIRFVPVERADLATFRKTVKAAFKQQFGYDAEISFVAEKSIERDPGGKFHASISKVV